MALYLLISSIILQWFPRLLKRSLSSSKVASWQPQTSLKLRTIVENGSRSRKGLDFGPHCQKFPVFRKRTHFPEKNAFKLSQSTSPCLWSFGFVPIVQVKVWKSPFPGPNQSYLFQPPFVLFLIQYKPVSCLRGADKIVHTFIKLIPKENLKD